MEIIFSKSAIKTISKLDKITKKRVKVAIEKIPYGDIKKLAGYTKTYRLRVGDWRILFNMDSYIEILNILPRGQAYKWEVIIMDIQRKYLHDLLDIVDKSELETLYHILIKFVPYDNPTEDEIEAINIGEKAIANGEFVNINDIDWN